MDVLGNESDVASQTFSIDTVPPTITNVSVTPENVGTTGNCLKGKLWVDADVADSGGSGLASVEIKLDDGDYEAMPLKSGVTYEMEYTIDATWDNGGHTVTIKATDGAGNSATASTDFDVNKNQIDGLVGLQGFMPVYKDRDVVFVLNGSGDAKVITLGFYSGVAAYSITDVPDLTSISAKTAWTMRRLISGLSASDGQYSADFTGANTLLGGDLTGDNVINALDYSTLRGAWGANAAGDITGDGYTDNADYVIMKTNWYKKGDAQ